MCVPIPEEQSGPSLKFHCSRSSVVPSSSYFLPFPFFLSLSISRLLSSPTLLTTTPQDNDITQAQTRTHTRTGTIYAHKQDDTTITAQELPASTSPHQRQRVHHPRTHPYPPHPHRPRRSVDCSILYLE